MTYLRFNIFNDGFIADQGFGINFDFAGLSGFPEGFFYAHNLRDYTTGRLLRLFKVHRPGGRKNVPFDTKKERSSLQASDFAL